MGDSLFLVLMNAFPYLERVVRTVNDRLNSAPVGPHQYPVRMKSIKVTSGRYGGDAKRLL
jgi:hypothetical protein